MKKIVFITTTILAFAPVFAFAHLPRINTQTETIVDNPEISKAYYGELKGEYHTYTIKSDTPFELYINILVPDIEGQRKDVSAAIVKDKNTVYPIAFIDGINFKWERFWEPFGRDWYYMGPEYKADVKAGEYMIVVWSENNDSKYSLAIGGIESFPLREGIKAVLAIPKIKKGFFNESPIGFILSPFGYGYIIIIYLLAFITAFVCRHLFRKFTQNSTQNAEKNISTSGRILRLVMGTALLLWTIKTSWNPILLFLSGLSLAEAVLGWCIIYAIRGKRLLLNKS